MPTLTIQPAGTTHDVEPGTLLRDALQSARVLLDYPCAGRGRCHQCLVKMDPAPRGRYLRTSAAYELSGSPA